MTLFPGLPRGVRRELLLPTTPETVMGWLTDAARREQDWHHAVNDHGMRDPSAKRLRNGGLRLQADQVQAGRVTRQVVKDTMIRERRIVRVICLRLRRRWWPGWGWVLRARITATPQGNATAVTVRMRGWPTRLTMLVTLFGQQDATVAQTLTQQAIRLADIWIASVSDYFDPR